MGLLYGQKTEILTNFGEKCPQNATFLKNHSSASIIASFLIFQGMLRRPLGTLFAKAYVEQLLLEIPRQSFRDNIEKFNYDSTHPKIILIYFKRPKRSLK